jgi:lysophospholipase L1-like esterase
MWFGGNDLGNLNEELNNEILIKYLNDQKFNQNLKGLQNKIDDQARKHILVRSEGSKYGFYKLRLLRTKLKMIINSNKDKKDNSKYRFDKLEKILSLTKKLSIENQSNLYFVYLSASRYLEYDKNPKEDLKYFENVKSIVEKLEINFIDIHKEVFEDKKDPLELFPFGIGGHYNVKGYREVAEAIYEHIIIKELN